MKSFDRIAQLASRQAGAISARQLRSLGLSRDDISYAHGRKQLLHTGHRGVYRIAGSPWSDDVPLWSALLWAGPPVFLSHVTAGWLWDLGGLGFKRPSTVDLIVEHARVIAGPKGITVHRSRSFRPGKHSSHVRGLPVTSLERTLVDLSQVLAPLALDKALDSATRRFPKIRESVWKLTTELEHRGREHIGAIVELSERPSLGASGSDLEVDVRDLLHRHGLLPLPQFQICDANGDQIGIFDFAWPEAMLVLEVHSKKWHSTWNERENDLSRTERLEDAGWKVLTITARRLRSDPLGFVARIRRVLEKRRGRSG